MRRNFLRVIFILSVGLLFSNLALAEQFNIVMKLQDTPESTVWRIDNPNVTKSVTDYPQIQFKPGDTVSIAAGGCVQTGGVGQTWKRYWNPSGSNSDRLYYGMIDIPGVTQGLMPIRQTACANQDTRHPDTCTVTFQNPIPDSIPVQNRHLSLGYKDDDYSDNGYSGHDDGTENQCKGVGNAFVIVSIGHGKPPVTAENFTGIAPDDFRCNAAWRFHNFDTAELSWQTFTDAFDLSWNDYLNPVTPIMYEAAKGMASGGNCAGMSLLALVGEDAFEFEDLTEFFWDQYSTFTMSPPQVQKDINTAHWKQLSTYFLTNWLHSRFDAPSTTAHRIQQDISNGNYGLLTLEHGWDGHVVVPLSLQSPGGSQSIIQVYDPNRPCNSKPDQSNYPPFVINGNSWSFTMGDGTTWTQKDGNIAYIPFQETDGWRDLTNGLGDVVQIIFGRDTNVQQITDKNGRQLFKNMHPQGLADLDTSANGLGNDIVRIPSFGWGGKRPRTNGPKFVLHSAPVPEKLVSRVDQMKAEYEQDYGFSKQIYLIRNLQLEGLEIKLSNSNPNRPVRALIHRQGQWYELRFDAASRGATINPSLIVHKMSDLSQGVSVRERNGVPMKVNFVHGLVSEAQKNINIQQTNKIDVGGTPVEAQIGKDNNLHLSTAGQEQRTDISTQVIESTGTVKQLPIRKQPIIRTQ